MLRGLTELVSYQIGARDGLIGTVDDFLINDEDWGVRYLVADTGNWLPGRKVVLSPLVIEEANWSNRVLLVDLTKDKIKNSPSLDSHEPVSRRMEKKLASYYGWPMYWTSSEPVVSGGMGYSVHPAAPPKDLERIEESETHLRSIKEVTGYHIQASDGSIGHVEDFIVDDETWIMRYLVVDTKNWLPGKKVLIVPAWLESVSWSDSEVKAALTKEQIENCPEYDPTAPINRGYEVQYYDYFGRPKYWEPS